MGSFLSKHRRRRIPQSFCGTLPPIPEPDGPSFLRPYQDPKAIDDHRDFPLDGQDLASVPEEQLLEVWSTGPRVHEYDGIKLVRIAKSSIMKGGIDITKSEAENMIFARESLLLPVPRVHRSFHAAIPKAEYKECQFIVMDYIAGGTVEQCWPSLDEESKASVVRQVAQMIEKLQSKVITDLAIGPLGHNPGETFQGPWFTDYGAGPFSTIEELEAYCNHKIEVCIMVQQLPPTAQRFQFKDVVFTHQDISPRNLILDEGGKVWLIDWGCAGIYPRGFEQAVLRQQSGNDEFADMVLAELSEKQEELTKQYRGIGYGLSTGRRL